MKRTCSLAVSVISYIAIVWLWSLFIDTRAIPEVASANTSIAASTVTEEITHTTISDFQAGIADNVNITPDNGGEIATAFLGGPFIPGTGALIWTRLADLPQAASLHTSFVSKGYLFVLDDSGVSSTPVYDDGTIGTWTSLPALPASCGSYPCTAVVSNGHVFLVGGNSASVHSAPLLENGAIGAWSALNPLPARVFGSQIAVVVKGHLFVIGGSYVAVVSYSAPINADGSIGPWSDVSRLPTTLGRHAVVANGDHIYVIGGTPAGGNSVKTVYMTDVEDDGTLGVWSTTTPFTAIPTCCVVGVKGHSAFAGNGYLFVAGGLIQTSQINYNNGIYAAAINPDGTLGAWSIPAIAGLAGGLGQFHSLARYNDYLFQSGGCPTDSACNVPWVFSAQIPTLSQPLQKGTFTHRFSLGGNDNVKALRWTAIGPSSTTSMSYRLASASSAIYGGWTPPTTTNPISMNQTAGYVEYRLQIHNPPGESIAVTDISLVVSPDYALVVSPTNWTLYQTEQVTYSIALSPTAMFDHPVYLQVVGIPTGTTATVTPDTISPGQTATLELAVSLSTPVDSYALTVIGTSHGLTRTSAFSLSVLPAAIDLTVSPPSRVIYQNQTATYTLSLDATPGFTYPARLGADALPGIAITFHPDEISPGQEALMELATSLLTPTGTQILTVTAGAASRQDNEHVELTVLPAEFSVAVTPLQQMIYQGQSATYAIAYSTSPGTVVPMMLAVEGPAGISATLTHEMIYPGEPSSLVITTGLSTPVDVHTITVTGLGEWLSGTSHVFITRTVQARCGVSAAGFTLTATPAVHTTCPGAASTFSIGLLSSTPGFPRPIQLTVVDLPIAVTRTISPAFLLPDSTAVLELGLPVTMPLGTYPFHVIGTAADITSATEITLQVRTRLFLPVVLKRWPPIPAASTLNPIENTDGDGFYMVTWPATELAELYILEEDDDGAFVSPAVVYQGANRSWSVSAPGRRAGTYYYRVRGHNTYGAGPYSNVQTVTVLLPGTPTLNAINNADGDGNYAVTWSTAARATWYTLQEDTTSGFPSPTTAYQGSELSWPATGKAAGTYYYRVRAHGPTGQSPWSNTRSVTVRPAGRVLSSNAFVPYAGSSSLYIVGEVWNNTGSNVGSVRINATLRDASGNVVDSYYSYSMMYVLTPGMTSPFLVSFSEPPAWSSYDLVVTWDTTSYRPYALQVLNTTSYFDSYDAFHVVGEIRNQYGELRNYIKALVTMYDANGKVIGVGSNYTNPDELSPGQTASFDTELYFWKYKPDKTKVASHRLQVVDDWYWSLIQGGPRTPR